mmetsp:Transcript_47052/g.102397  ORF Transcript_47052/g.102397 Transcript_47052/m.102397 type:complete len:175 (-) Transcript_47052:105-629(-)
MAEGTVGVAGWEHVDVRGPLPRRLMVLTGQINPQQLPSLMDREAVAIVEAILPDRSPAVHRATARLLLEGLDNLPVCCADGGTATLQILDLATRDGGLLVRYDGDFDAFVAGDKERAARELERALLSKFAQKGVELDSLRILDVFRGSIWGWIGDIAGLIGTICYLIDRWYESE